MFKLIKGLLAGDDAREIKNLMRIVEQVNALEPEFEKLNTDSLAAKTGEFRERLRRGETLDSLLPEAYALVREGAKRTLGQRHFDVQVLGAIVLHQGRIAEMKTGEGKTLVATMPAYLNALPGQGVHVVTVNDYLARRDSEWMGQIYKLLGLEVGLIVHGLEPAQRRQAYLADITYGTNNEFGLITCGTTWCFTRNILCSAPKLRHHRRGGQYPHRRGRTPDHLRCGGAGHQPVPLRPAGAAAASRRRLHRG